MKINKNHKVAEFLQMLQDHDDQADIKGFSQSKLTGKQIIDIAMRNMEQLGKINKNS